MAMQEPTETMKKAWKDASSTPEGKTPSAMETSDDAFDFKDLEDLEATETGDTNFDRISGDLKGAIGQVDSTAGDMDMVYEAGIYEVGVYQTAADDAASSLGSSMGF